MLRDLETEFAGPRRELIRLAFRLSILSVLTLGIYRFWQKTRLRRWYWSAIRPGGTPLEYVGDPLEKLLGFLVAVVFLAFYIGVVNLILFFVSFAVLDGNASAYLLSLLGIVPFFFFARYRARRYMLARTRWRGIRFGLEPGAWGYAWRAIGHWLLTIVSLGLLWPRMTFYLEKYKTDRTWFGDVKLEQGGNWRMLYRPARWAYLAVLLLGVSLLLSRTPGEAAGLGGVVMLLAAGFAVYGYANYRVQSFALLAKHKTAGGLSLHSAPRTGRMIGIYVAGYLAIFASLIFLLIVAGTVLSLFSGLFAAVLNAQDLGQVLDDVPSWFGVVAAVATYFLFFVTLGVLHHAFILLPRLAHYAETLTVSGAPSLILISQRPPDAAPEAGGFAEALDVGAAI